MLWVKEGMSCGIDAGSCESSESSDDGSCAELS